jgi:extracellular elastinolytic metalloproteinase
VRVLPLLTIALAISFIAPSAALADDATAISKPGGFLTAPRAGTPNAVAKRWLNKNKARFGLDRNDVTALKLSSSQKLHGGATHLEFTQSSLGIEAFRPSIVVNVSEDGRVINAGGTPTSDLSIASAKPTVTAGEARSNAQKSLGVRSRLPAGYETAKLVVFSDSGGDHLSWKLVVAGKQPRIYSVLVDAKTGKVLAKNSLTDFVDGSVFENHPGAAAGGTQVPVTLDDWLDNPLPTTQLSGPNTYVFADPNHNAPVNENDPSPEPDDFRFADSGEDIAPGTYAQTSVAPSAASPAQFCPSGFANPSPCTWSGNPPDVSQPTNFNERGVQLFYFVNAFHDWLQQPDINFNGFQGNDRVIAQTDDGNGADCNHLNNANMTTLPDGESPLMQMYFFGRRSGCGSFPAVSSADDASVVMHEYTHGLSNRLIGNGNGLLSWQSGAMGEAWSDFYAMDYLVSKGFETDTPASGEIAVGKYVTNDHAVGIRYEAIDCAVVSLGAACGGTAGAPKGGFTYADLGHVDTDPAEVHSNGEIWAQTLWDLRRALGPSLARKRITDGMRLSPNLDPSFLDERNAILSADAIAGGANINAIWAVFAARGMGCSARSPNADSTTTVTAAFDTGGNGHCGPAPAPKPTVGNRSKTARLDKKGRFKFHFTASPANAGGKTSFKTASKIRSGKKRKILALGSRLFNVRANGKVDLQIQVSKSTRKKLKHKRKVGAKVTIVLAGTTFKSSLTLKR